MADTFGLPSTSLAKIQRMLNAKRAAGIAVQPSDLESAYEAEMSALAGKQVANRQLGISEASLAETKRMNDVNARLKEDEISAGKQASTLGAVGQVGTTLLMGKALGLWGKPAVNPTNAAPLSTTPEGAAAIQAGTKPPGTYSTETGPVDWSNVGRTKMTNTVTPEVIPKPTYSGSEMLYPEGSVDASGQITASEIPVNSTSSQVASGIGDAETGINVASGSPDSALSASYAGEALGQVSASDAALSASYAGEGAAGAAEAGAGAGGGFSSVAGPIAIIAAANTARGLWGKPVGTEDRSFGNAFFNDPLAGPPAYAANKALGESNYFSKLTSGIERSKEQAFAEPLQKAFSGDIGGAAESFAKGLYEAPITIIESIFDCIIITACTSPHSPEVNIARSYRDQYMDPLELRGYYMIAEKVVPLIARYPLFKRFIKRFLVDGIIDYCEYAIGQKSTLPRPWSSFVMKSFLGVCGFVGSRRPSFTRCNGEVF